MFVRVNRAINNPDGHEHNFSLIHNGEGYCLAPAYDMVPSLITGAYSVASYQYIPVPPKPGETKSLGKVFGLPKTVVKQIADEVIKALEQWEKWAQLIDVSDGDFERVSKVIRL